jgi:hypothetical protein
MTTNEMRDPILRLLASLPAAIPPATLDQRVRSRCHVALARRHRLPVHRTQLPIIPAGVINATLAITAGIYAAAAALEALRLVGML